VSGVLGTYELLVAPVVFALCVRHTVRALGGARATVELAVLVLYGVALERLTMSVFASHVYSDSWRVAPFGVPLAVVLVWASLIPAGLALAARLGLRGPLARAAAATVLGLVLDLLMEPVAVAADLWRWTPPGHWLGVPVGNFVGWTVIVGLYVYGVEAFTERGSLAGQALRRGLVSLLALGGLVGIGFVWRGLQFEEALPSWAGWVVWGAVVVAAVAMSLRRRWSAVGTTLGSRLGAVPGHESALVFLVTAAAFSTHAAFLGRADVGLAAAGSTLALLILAGGDIHHAALASWRERMHGRLAGVTGLVAVLMKRRNGEPWTLEESTFLRSELRALAQWAPALALFVLPGSVVLLPLYAWLLDRRRVEESAAAGRRHAVPSRPTAARRSIPERRRGSVAPGSGGRTGRPSA
jgi:Carotenoid biosynthesis protein